MDEPKARIVKVTNPVDSVSYRIEKRHFIFRWWVDANEYCSNYPSLQAAREMLPFHDGTPWRPEVIPPDCPRGTDVK